MKNLLLALITLLVISSCSVTRNANREKTGIDSTSMTRAVLDVQADIKTVNDQTSKTTVVETIDTVYKVDGRQITGSRQLIDLLAGVPLILADNGLTMAVIYDSCSGLITGTATMAPVTFPIHSTKTTTTETTNKTKQSAGLDFKSKVIQTADIKKDSTTKTTARHSNGMPPLVTSIITVVLLFVLIWYLWRQWSRR